MRTKLIILFAFISFGLNAQTKAANLNTKVFYPSEMVLNNTETKIKTKFPTEGTILKLELTNYNTGQIFDPKQDKLVKISEYRITIKDLAGNVLLNTKADIFSNNGTAAYVF